MSDRYKGGILSGTAPTVTPQGADGVYTLSQQLQYQGQGVWPTAAQNPITQSLRFRSSASAYLNRTPASAGNRRTYTWSGWVKRGILGSRHQLFSAAGASTNTYIEFQSDQILIEDYNPGVNMILRTTAVQRDPSAWYHFVIAVDTTQATSSNRLKIYINGVQQTAFATATYPSQNYDTAINSTVVHKIGQFPTNSDFSFDGYLGEVNFIDGVALTPSSFGTTDVNGIWQPIPYTGAYGTNGFYLPFNATNLSATYLVVGGGGGGGQGNGGGYGCGGGGAGGLLTGTTVLNSGTSYTVTVGAGGAGGVSSNQGTSGSSSSAFGLTASGGGGGGSFNTPAGLSGASGGGGGGGNAVTGTGGTGVSGQGFAGGTKSSSHPNCGGGGGGAGSVGADTPSGSVGGNGGTGVTSSISGASVGYAGGGGGGGNGVAGTGTQGGGAGANGADTAGSGTANTGGGGGASPIGITGAGGSGVVIVSYAGSAMFTGGTITSVGGNTIHTFTSSGTLASTLGIASDASGNDNNWTANNISLASGSTYDPMLDSPSNASSTIGNYATGSPVASYSNNITWTNGNLALAIGLASEWRTSMIPFSLPSTKWYWEVTLTATVSSGDLMVGIINSDIPTATISGNSEIGSQTYGYGYYSGGLKIHAGANSSYGSSWYTSGDVIGVAFDSISGELTFYQNGTSQGVAYTVDTSKTYAPAISGTKSGGTTPSVAFNFGQQPFVYTPPTGFNNLNTYNLPVPTIPAGNTVMDATLYTGNGTTQSITNTAGFKPDFVWIKQRNGTRKQNWYDSVRGVGKELYSNLADAETSAPDSLTAFNSNGFSLGNDGGSNVNAGTFVGWQWQAGQGTTSSNTNGTITSTVSVNTTAGFSIVKWLGNGVTAATVGHGLGVVPAMIICKEIDGTDYWHVKHQSTASNTNLYLNTTNASTSAALVGDGVLGDLSSSSTFGFATAGSPGNVVAVNENGINNIAYCWAAVAGYSAFGSYTGNGSTDGPFVYTGFRPRFFIIKRTDTTTNWIMYDTVRQPYNTTNPGPIYANLASAEESNVTLTAFDILSNGFKPRNTSSWAESNASGGTYIYMAFAENPFKMARAR